MDRSTMKNRRMMERDAQVAELKKTLSDMEASRQRKQLALLRRNEEMIHRDAARHEQFLREYKTPEQLAEEAAQVEVMRLQAIMESLLDDEDDRRTWLEEEEAVEHKLLLQELRLAFVCITVYAVQAEYQKIDFQKQLKQEELARVQASYEKLKVTLSAEESEKRRQVERVCNTEWRVLESMKRADDHRCQLEEQKRNEEEQKREVLQAQEQNQKDERQGTMLLEEEEDNLQREYQERLLRIETKFKEGAARCHTTTYQ
jgi:hypothetical protein